MSILKPQPNRTETEATWFCMRAVSHRWDEHTSNWGGGEDQDGRWDKIVMVFDWLLATSPPQPPMPISRLTGGRGLQIMVRNRRKGRSGKRCCWERHETWEFYNFINYSGGKLFVNLWMVAMVQGCMVGLFNIKFKQKDLCYFFVFLTI